VPLPPLAEAEPATIEALLGTLNVVTMFLISAPSALPAGPDGARVTWKVPPASIVAAAVVERLDVWLPPRPQESPWLTTAALAGVLPVVAIANPAAAAAVANRMERTERRFIACRSPWCCRRVDRLDPRATPSS